MRSSSLITRLRGYVRIEIRGREAERFINRAAASGIAVWDVRRTSPERMELCVVIPHFFRLRPLLKETGCRMRLRGRYGFPFWLGKVARRKFFAIGLLLFVVGLYMLSSFVWHISVEGNERIPSHAVLEAARKFGIYPLQWKPRLHDPDTLSRELLSQLPGAAWVGVDIEGTRVRIKVVESARPDPRELMNPRHLVAAKPAEVTVILAEAGKPMVKPHSVVRKGDILISGIIGEAPNQQVVVAKGVVRGIVWEKVRVEVPLVQKARTFTGESERRYYITFGDRAFRIWGFGEPGFENHESIYMRHGLQWRSFKSPVGWMDERLMSTEIEETQLEPDDARQIALERARVAVIASAGPEARLAGEKLLSEKVENGRLYLEALMEVERDIAEEAAIVPHYTPAPPQAPG